MKQQIIKMMERMVPEVTRLTQERDRLQQELSDLQRRLFVPPGHFYSPIPSLDEVRERAEKIFRIPKSLPGIDLNEEEQWKFFAAIQKYYKEMPFKSHKSENLRYFFENDSYSYSDAICLYSMIRQARPKRVIEVGSGYSSCVTLDTNELFFDQAISCLFIEPYPALLLSLLKDGDRERIEVLPAKLQEVELQRFLSLEENDILFIDSTHVSKVNSDVNYIFFEILPALKSGVYIHFHDVFYPFEYPRPWIEEGRAWNEDYILRAFLQYNDAFRIVFFNTFLEHFYKEEFAQKAPLCLKNPGGSIWLRKA